MDTLSGGLRQRAWIAMTLAQETEWLLLDEPTTFLDIALQIDVLHLLQRVNVEVDRSVLIVVHHLNQASRYAHHLIAMKDGAVVVADDPLSLITPPLLREIFGVEADVARDPRTGALLSLPYAL